MGVSIDSYLMVSLMLFAIGFFGVLSRRNLLVLLMSIELMLNAVNLAFVAFSQLHAIPAAGVAALFVISISAAEAGVGLTLIVLISRRVKKDTQWVQEILNS